MSEAQVSDAGSARREQGGMPDAEAVRDTPWHARGGDEAAEALGVDRDSGLDDAEAERRQERFGPNELPKKERDSLFKVFLRQFSDPLVYVLLIAGVVSLFIGNFADAGFIFVVLLLNAGLGTYQEYKAEETAAALEEVMTIKARVIRGGEEREVDSVELVPGDILQLSSGSAVPADVRLLQAKDLRSDESLLTGESTPVEKHADAEVEEDAATGERDTLVHAGSTIMSGRATGVVVRTGKATELGRIAESLAEDSEEPPLVVRMKRFTRIIAIGILGVILVLGLIQFLRGAELVDLFMLAVALAVSAIPAGLPVAITVALSIASHRMAQNNVIVRNLPAVEGLGACTLIATDKTGTLTENQLTVRQLAAAEEEAGSGVDVTGTGEDLEGELTRDEAEVDLEQEEWLRELVVAGALCNEGSITEGDEGLETEGDTVDVALLVLARKVGLDRESLLDEQPQVGEIPFESERKFAASFHRRDDGVIAYVKGATEAVAEMCDIDVETVQQREEALAAEGFRVIAVASGTVDEEAAREGDAERLQGLRFLGLVGLIDPVRDEVHDAVAQCRSAGIDVCMITGDHPATGLAIARQLKFADDDAEAATGKDIAEAEEGRGDVVDRIRSARVFARVEPLQKTRIVEILQDAGHFVAVTGDGVNDAPALRRAHIGVAMGKSGTDVARGAADLILTDDNFASIVKGVEQGRVAYDNVRKVIWLLISTAVAELVLFTLAVAFDMPLPLTPVQLLWLNLVTNGIQDVALAFEKGEPGVLDRRPRRPDEPIFNRLMIEEVLTSGIYMGLVAFGAFYVLHEMMGFSTFDARNLLVLLLVLFENVHIFNVRSESRSAFRIPLSNNWLLVGAVVAAQGVHIISMFIPGWRDVLQIEPVSFTTWGLLLLITLTKFGVVEIYKKFRGRELAMRNYGQLPAGA